MLKDLKKQEKILIESLDKVNKTIEELELRLQREPNPVQEAIQRSLNHLYIVRQEKQLNILKISRDIAALIPQQPGIQLIHDDDIDDIGEDFDEGQFDHEGNDADALLEQAINEEVEKKFKLFQPVEGVRFVKVKSKNQQILDDIRMKEKKESKLASIKYFNGDLLAANIFYDKYAMPGELTPDDMFFRLTSELSRIEQKYPNPIPEKEIRNLLLKFEGLILGGSNMFGIGNDKYISSLGNCFVVGNNHDSYGGIMNLDQELVQIMKRRGGVGLDISHLRPKDTQVQNSAKTSTGAVSFAPRFSNSTQEVAQSGRRGALMLTMDFSHPDALDFIKSKSDLTKLNGANISVKIDNNTMDELLYEFGRKGDELGRFNPYGLETIEKFKEIAKAAHKTAEPGVLFFEQITKLGPADQYPGFKSTSTNPCGELPLPPYDSCRLASIATYYYVKNPFTNKAEFQWEKFADDVVKSQRLMDDIVDLELEKIQLIKDKITNDPEPEEVKAVEWDLWDKIEKKCLEGRRTGLGMTGIADTLAALGLDYCSKAGNEFEDELFRTFAINSYKASIIMAKERGAFPIFNHEIEFGHEYIERIMSELDDHTGISEMYAKYGRRNIANMAIAPTGSLSILAGVSSGIEPVFKIYYNRRRRISITEDTNENIKTFIDKSGEKWEEYKVIHKPFLKYCQVVLGINSTKVLAMPDDALDELIKHSIYNNNDAHSVDPFEKATMQGMVQKWIDHSISVTYNLPEETTAETILQLYLHAYEAGCKGATVYREGSRQGILTSTKSEENLPVSERPIQVPCNLHFTTIKGEKWIIIIGLVANKLYEVFAFKVKDIDGDISKIKEGYLYKVKSKRYDLLDKEGNVVVADITSYFGSPEEEYVTRFISTMLQNNISIETIYEQIMKPKSGDITSFAKGIARVLSKYVDMESISVKETCPNCDSDLKMAEGCITCMSCGYSRC